VGFVVDNISWAHVFLRVIRGFFVSNIQTISYTDLYMLNVVTGRKSGSNLGAHKKLFCFGNGGEHGINNYFVYIKYNENPSSGSREIPCGRTDRHDETDNRF
jgi:hypothetical protein